MEKLTIEYSKNLANKVTGFRIFVWDWCRANILNSLFSFALILYPAIENLQATFALLYVIGANLFMPVVGLGCLYYLNKLAIKTDKPATDPTNITLFDRCLALCGFILPCAELCRFFPHEITTIPWLHALQIQYLTGLMLLLNLNDFNFVIANILVFRGIIRRRGPDTKWSGTRNKFWIKYFIRYHWCYGSCLMTLLEVYMYIHSKILCHLSIPMWGNIAIAGGMFYISAAVLGYSAICALLGTIGKMPLIHGACEFHVGQPNK